MNYLPSATLKSALIALGIFVVAALLYFLPSIQGKTLKQGDVTQFNGSATEIIDYREQGRQIYWTNVMFSGMPNHGISVIDPGNWVRYIPMVFTKSLGQPIGLFILMCLGFYVLMMALNIDARVAIISSLAYALSSYFIIILEAGHNAKFHAMAYLPGILAGMIWAYRQKKPWQGAAVLGIFTALELNARHPQMFYYFAFVLLFVGLAELVIAIRKGAVAPFVKTTLMLLVAAFLAVGTQYAYLKRTLDYSKQSTRGSSELKDADATAGDEGLTTDYITNWSYGKSETFSWLIPNYKGGVSRQIGADSEALEAVDGPFRQAIAGQSQYFGDQPFVGGPVYLGAIVVLFAFYGMFFLKHKYRIPILMGLVLMTMLSWGKNFSGLTDFFIENVPLYNKFRAVSSIMVVPSLLMPLLGAMALNKLIKNPQSLTETSVLKQFSNEKLFYVVAGLLLAFTAISYVAPDTFNSFLSDREAETLPQQLAQAGITPAQSNQFIDSLESARKMVFKQDAGRTLALLLLATAAVFLWRRKVLKTPVFIIGLGVVIVAELWMVDRRYLNQENFVNESQAGPKMTAADAAILQDQDLNYRVLNLTVSPFNDATTSFFHKSIGGYSGIKLKKYQELIDYYLQSEIQALSNQLRNSNGRPQPQQLFGQTPVMNMLNTKYVIINPQGQPLQNPQRNGVAWFVNSVKEVESPDAEIKALGQVNLKSTAVLEQDELNQLSSQEFGNGQGTIQLQSYDPEKMVYQAQSQTGGLAVFSEVYYPSGWTLKIDGEEAPLVKANYLLRAAYIPAGNHTVEMTYDADFGLANTLSLVSFILLLGLMVTAFVMEKRKAQAEPKD